MHYSIGVLLVFIFGYVIGGYNSYKSSTHKIIEKCEENLPRNQVCELKAVPVVNTKEIKEKENN